MHIIVSKYGITNGIKLIKNRNVFQRQFHGTINVFVMQRVLLNRGLPLLYIIKF